MATSRIAGQTQSSSTRSRRGRRLRATIIAMIRTQTTTLVMVAPEACVGIFAPELTLATD